MFTCMCNCKIVCKRLGLFFFWLGAQGFTFIIIIISETDDSSTSSSTACSYFLSSGFLIHDDHLQPTEQFVVSE